MSTGLFNSKDLHLPDLSIKGFRGIEQLSIPRLGRVTLIAGMNGAGKTTLLDAVRVYASRASYSVLTNTLRHREEVSESIDEDGRVTTVPNWEALFFGRRVSSGSQIEVGPENHTARVVIQTLTAPVQEDFFDVEDISLGDSPLLRVEFQGGSREYHANPRDNLRHSRRSPDSGRDLPARIVCESLGPSVPDNLDMARFWDKVALTDDESRAMRALNLIFGGRVERVALVGDDRRVSRTPYGRRAVVKISGEERPVPLKSLGDGAVRLFAVALALANSQNGFLLVDEAENGIHHSVQSDFWKMVLTAADTNNVQVLATTHSWDCVAGFAHAATESEAVDGLLIRIERNGENVRALEYTEEDLRVAAQQGIEVR